MALRRALAGAIRGTAASSLGRGGGGGGGGDALPFWRTISSSTRSSAPPEESTQTSVEKFQELFDKYRPSMMDPPSTPTTYMPAGDLPKSGEEEVKNAGPPPESVKLNFRLPHEAVFADEEVNMVLVPAETGDFGILPGHVPVVAKLRPGVVSVENKENVTSKVRRVSSIFERSIDRKTERPFFARARTNERTPRFDDIFRRTRVFVVIGGI